MSKSKLSELATPQEVMHMVRISLIGRLASLIGFVLVLKQLTEKHGAITAVALVIAFIAFSVVVGGVVAVQPSLAARFRVGVPADVVVMLTLMGLGVRGLCLYLLAIHYIVFYYRLCFTSNVMRRLPS